MVYTYLLDQDKYTDPSADTLGEKHVTHKPSPALASVHNQHYMQKNYIGTQCHFEIIEVFQELKIRRSGTQRQYVYNR
jgi:hypothetical protein